MPPEAQAAAPVTSAPAETPGSAAPAKPPVTNASSKEINPPDVSQKPEMWDVKVNGKIVKMTRQEALDSASMAHAANDRFNEAKKMRGDVDKIIQNAKTNPIAALMDPAIGLTRDEVRVALEKWYDQEFIQPDTLTPEQKRIKELEAKNKKYEDDELAKKTKDEETEHERAVAQHRTDLQQQIVETMEKSGLPKTKFLASRIAFYMRQNAQNKYDAPMEMIIKQVKAERSAELSDLGATATAPELIAMLGDAVINKIRQHDLEQLRLSRNRPAVTTDAPINNRRGAGTGPMGGRPERPTMADVNRNLRAMREGK